MNIKHEKGNCQTWVEFDVWMWNVFLNAKILVMSWRLRILPDCEQRKTVSGLCYSNILFSPSVLYTSEWIESLVTSRSELNVSWCTSSDCLLWYSTVRRKMNFLWDRLSHCHIPRFHIFLACVSVEHCVLDNSWFIEFCCDILDGSTNCFRLPMLYTTTPERVWSL